jgi:hypothetical protein
MLDPIRDRPAIANLPPTAGVGFTPLQFSLLLATLIIAAYPDVVLGIRTFYFRDFGLFGYPLAHHGHESFWRGEIPLWNPLNHCGLPFLAQWNTLVLYPGSLFYLVFPPVWALGVFCLLHLFFAGVGMYFLACRWTENRLAASVAGAAFAINGLSLHALMWPNNIAALGWMPWVILSADRAGCGDGRRLAAAAIIGATQMLTGAPEIILFTWLILGASGLIRWIRGESPRGRLAANLALLALLVAALGAAQLLPFFNLLRFSQRSFLYADAAWSMPGTGWVNFLVPLFRTFLSRQGVYYQDGQYWTSSYYAGVCVLMLAALALVHRREWRVWFLAALALGGVILALGDNGPIHAALRRLVPQLGFMRFPIKFVAVDIFCLPLLAGFGIRAMIEMERRGRLRPVVVVWGGLLALIGSMLWFSGWYPSADESPAATLRSGLTRAVFLTAGPALIILCLRSRGRAQCLARVALVSLVGADVLTHALRQNPTVPLNVMQPGLATFRNLDPLPRHGQSRAMVSPEADARLRYGGLSSGVSDYLATRIGLFSNCNLLEDIPKINGFYSLFPREAAQVWALVYQRTNPPAPALYDLMSVSQMTAPGEVFEWQRRSNYLAFASAGQRPVFADDGTTYQALAGPDFNPHREVYLPLEARTSVQADRQTQSEVVSARFGSHRAEIEVKASERGMVVVSQTFYPAWSAFVDGAPARLWRANHAFQALEVPAGNHRVTLLYRDRAFLAGTLLSVAALTLCIRMSYRRLANALPTAMPKEPA